MRIVGFHIESFNDQFLPSATLSKLFAICSELLASLLYLVSVLQLHGKIDIFLFVDVYHVAWTSFSSRRVYNEAFQV